MGKNRKKPQGNTASIVYDNSFYYSFKIENIYTFVIG